MDEETQPSGDEKFSDDPEENLEMENMFLKMKLMAESGAEFQGDAKLPPDVLNQWLKHIAAVAKSDGRGEKPLRELLGNPEFPPSKYLDTKAFRKNFERLRKLLQRHKVYVEFRRRRNNRFKYDFITGELMDHLTVLFPGMNVHYCYEELHPDHELDIIDNTEAFLEAFFQHQLVKYDFWLGSKFIQPDGKILSKAELLDEIEGFYDLVIGFEHVSFQVKKIEFSVREEDEVDSDTGGKAGEGFTSGTATFECVFGDGDRVRFEGPFKVYFELEYGYWTIFYFYLPGFNLSRDGNQK